MPKGAFAVKYRLLFRCQSIRVVTKQMVDLLLVEGEHKLTYSIYFVDPEDPPTRFVCIEVCVLVSVNVLDIETHSATC